ncbi:hypothetical protein CJD38_17765 [Stenotrophobium rhamnosiphilum]|uniref:DUF2147 domain-containing protein n=2 Tax=Stenotrophobium rhamnosiphilum TaxID=2029166 RepID=A0A2T5MBB6_9GAMM|nr:hypothetical protein CJD38_17765 [Stenotrophobium rhamnosiphilum]
MAFLSTMARVPIALKMAAMQGLVSEIEEDITGYWLKHSNNHDDAIIAIYQNADVYDGRIVKLAHPIFNGDEGLADIVPPAVIGKNKTDVFHPDPLLRSRPLEGMRIIAGLRSAHYLEWSGAYIYCHGEGRTYQCKARLSDDGKSLQIETYRGKSTAVATQTWTRLRSSHWPV